jgi:hypothetical protein
MQTFLRESALLEPVRGNLRRRGYLRTRDEVQFFEYSVDLYGYAAKRDATTAVELKLDRWRRAFVQALIYQLCADFVYLALPARTAERVDLPLLERHGLGLIAVHPGLRCTVPLEARQSTVIMPSYREFYIELMQKSLA